VTDNDAGERQGSDECDFESRRQWLEGLYSLNAVVEAQGELLVGNLFYPHGSGQDYGRKSPDPVLRLKRDRFRSALRGKTRLLEIGINGGHSAYLALSSNPDLHYHGVDICDHAYVEPAVAWLQRQFPGRVYVDYGDSLKVLPTLVNRRLTFDAFHVDGCKEAYFDDIVNCSRMVDQSGGLVIVDDIGHPGVARRWRRCRRLGILRPSAGFPARPESGNQVDDVVPSPLVKWGVLIGYARTLNVIRRARATRARLVRKTGRHLAVTGDGATRSPGERS
jgi:hypothetical protein